MHWPSAIFVLLWFFFVPVAWAEPAEEPPRELGELNLSKAEILFAARNREVQLAKRAVEGAEADTLSAAQRPNPVFSINTTEINSDMGAGPGRLKDKRVDTVFRLDQLIERGGKRELRSATAQFRLEASRNDLGEIEREARLALYSAYYNLLLAQEKGRIAEETAALFQKTLDAAERRLKAGDIAASEAARIRVEALRSQNDARAARAESEKARLALGYLIGFERHAEKIRATDPWPELDFAPVESPLEEALEKRPDVMAAQARAGAAEKTRELARSLKKRDVTVGVQYERFPSDNSHNTYGIGISIPLFIHYGYEGEIRRAEAELAGARDETERVRAQARVEIARARSDLEATRERAKRHREVLFKEAKRAADAAEFAYNNGALGVMDLLDARRTLRAVAVDAATVQADYAKALAAWRLATTQYGPLQ